MKKTRRVFICGDGTIPRPPRRARRTYTPRIDQPDRPAPALKELREGLGLSQRRAAFLVRVTPNTWARWERNELKPSPSRVALIERLPDLLPKPKTRPVRTIPTGMGEWCLDSLETRDKFLSLGPMAAVAAHKVHLAYEREAARAFTNILIHMIEAGDHDAAALLIRMPNGRKATVPDNRRPQGPRESSQAGSAGPKYSQAVKPTLN